MMRKVTGLVETISDLVTGVFGHRQAVPLRVKPETRLPLTALARTGHPAPGTLSGRRTEDRDV